MASLGLLGILISVAPAVRHGIKAYHLRNPISTVAPTELEVEGTEEGISEGKACTLLGM